YGTGSIMAVPGQDERDWEFAEEFELPIVRTVQTPDDFDGKAYLGDGPAINSGFLDGLGVDDAKQKIGDWLVENGFGEPTVTYKLRDWLFSRQRYWGEPFPIVYGEDGSPRAVPDSMLPVELPALEDFRPAALDPDDADSDPEPPLARAEQWLEVELDLGDGPKRYVRETNTMPQWAGSCWYYLRYLDPTNEDALVDREVEQYWMPPGGVDLYVGGVEHAVLHLLYARFWHKVLFDLGVVSTPEPFQRLFNQGYIQAPAFRDARGFAVEASEVEEPEDRRDARRHLPRLRRGHAASLRDVHGPARREPPVEHRRHHRRAPVPATTLAQRGRRGLGRAAGLRRRGRRRHPTHLAPHDRCRPRRHGGAQVQHRDRATDRAQQRAHEARGE